MKTSRVTFLVSFLALSACAHAEDVQDKTSGRNGEVRDVPDFDGVEVSHGIQAQVKVGPKSVRLEGPADLVSRVKLEVRDGKLSTQVDSGMFNSFRGSRVHLYVSNPRVTSVGASGGSDVEAEATRTGEFEAEASGGATVVVSGVDSDSVDVEASGGSRVTLKGHADSVEAEASGGAVVNATELKGVKKLEAEASGGSRVEADAPEHVSGDASGGSTIRLAASPKHSDVSTSGGSRVTTRD